MLTFDTPTLVTITAPTCSGKNYLRDLLEKEFGWGRIVSTTTREMRVGEVEGSDYCFISQEESIDLERTGQFAELVEFRGTRYGVTRQEMFGKMDRETPPMVILEPQGLALYKKMCVEEGWNVFSIYINTKESTRIERLNTRTVADLIRTVTDLYKGSPSALEKIVRTHTDRLLSITTEERGWSNVTNWDAIVPGDDANKALDYVRRGVEWQNKENKRPVPYVHTA